MPRKSLYITRKTFGKRCEKSLQKVWYYQNCQTFVLSPAFTSKLKRKQHSKEFFVMPTVGLLNQVSLCPEQMYGRKAQSIVASWALFFSTKHRIHCQHYVQKADQVSTKNKRRTYICQVNLNLLCSSSQFQYNAAFGIITILSTECAHGLLSSSKGRVEARFETVGVCPTCKFCIKIWYRVTTRNQFHLKQVYLKQDHHFRCSF